MKMAGSLDSLLSLVTPQRTTHLVPLNGKRELKQACLTLSNVPAAAAAAAAAVSGHSCNKLHKHERFATSISTQTQNRW
jgi:hypothetical protein